MSSWDRIFALMKARKITAAELARQIGIAQSNFTEWKKQRSQPGYGALVKIAEFFDVAVEYLEGGTDDPALPSDGSKFTSLETQELFGYVNSLPKENAKKYLTIIRVLENQPADNDLAIKGV